MGVSAPLRAQAHSEISTEQLKSVALRYWKQALQMTKPKKVLAEMLLEIIDTLSNNILDLLSQPECPLVSQEDISRALEPCLTDIFDFLLSTSHDACAPLFKALSAVVCSSVNAGQSHSEIQPKTSYVPPKEHLVKMMHLIKPLLRFARDQECGNITRSLCLMSHSRPMLCAITAQTLAHVVLKCRRKVNARILRMKPDLQR
uniref:Uncharacterized protein n=1 Tax=Knipowitschia caucasica TaxID=637954 RepID=A0AAV2M8F0_KNICA